MSGFRSRCRSLAAFSGILPLAWSIAAHGQSASTDEVQILAAAIAFRLRSDSDSARQIIVDSESYAAGLSSAITQRFAAVLEMRRGTLEDWMTCSEPRHGPFRTLNDCKLPDGLVVMTIERPSIQADSAVVRVSTYRGSTRHGIHLDSLELQLARWGAGWRVTEVLGRGAS